MQGGVLASATYAHLTAFFIRGRNICTISNFRGGGAYASYATQLHTALNIFQTIKNVSRDNKSVNSWIKRIIYS